MRISTSTIYNANVSLLNQQQAKLLHTQQQIASGRRILTPADDPIGSARALDVTQSDATNTQYATNRNAARHTTSLAEGILKSATEILQDVRTTAVYAGDGTLTSTDKQILATELKSRLNELMALANSTDGIGNYLFSGFQGRALPFAESASGVQYLADDGQRMVQVSSSRQLATSDSGADIFMRIKNGNGTFATGQVTTPLTLSTNATIASPVVTAATAGAVNGPGLITFTPNAAATGTIAAGALTIQVGAGPVINVGAITLDGINNAANIAAAFDTAYVAAGGSPGTFTAAAGVVSKAADAGISFTFGIGGSATSAAAAATTRSTLASQTGLSYTQLGTQAYTTNNVTVASTATLVVGATITGGGFPAGTTVQSIINGTTFTTSAAAVPANSVGQTLQAGAGNTGTGIVGQGAVTNPALLTGNNYLVTFAVSTPQTVDANATITGGTAVTVASTASLAVGTPISGAGFPSGTTVTAITSGTTFTTSAATSITAFPATGQLIGIPGGVITYGVTNTTTGVAVAAPAATTLNPYVSGQAISFDGLRLDVTGTPANGDAFTVVPSTNESIFKTISDLITALGAVNTSGVGAAAAQFTNSLNTALNNLDRDLDNISAMRASQGTRLRELDALQSAGEDLGLQFKQTLTQLQDVDYNQAISDLTLQKIGLEASQKSFLTVSGLSLFNYM